MSTNFPASLDTLANPAATDGLTGHASQHANANDAIEALQAKVGVDGSAVASSIDYRVSAIESGKGAANGYAPLGADSKVPAAYLPSYVYASKTISANTTLNADTEYETGRNLRVNHGVKLTVPSTTLLIVRKYAAGSSL